MSARPFLMPPPTSGRDDPTAPVVVIPPPRRRGLLGAVAALAVTPVVAEAVPAASPDAELIRRCALAVEAHRAYRAYLAGGLPLEAPMAQHRLREDEEDRLLAHADGLWVSADEIPARTLEGVRAKARVLLAAALHNTDGSRDHDYHGREAWRVVEEMMRLESVA